MNVTCHVNFTYLGRGHVLYCLLEPVVLHVQKMYKHELGVFKSWFDVLTPPS